MRQRADPSGGAGCAAVRPDLEPIYRAQYPRIVGIAGRVLGDRGQAEDVAQEAFLGLARTTMPADAAPGWLAVAAAHLALNALRGDARRSRRERVVAVPEQVEDVAERVVTDDSRARVRAALVRLPRTQGLVVVLRHSGLSYQEIATALDLPAGSVGTTLRRAEAAVRKELSDDESLV